MNFRKNQIYLWYIISIIKILTYETLDFQFPISNFQFPISNFQFPILVFLFFNFANVNLYSQSAIITGPNELEVGIPANFTVTFTPSTDTSLQQVATHFQWSIPNLGTGGQGQSNIKGYIKSLSENPPFKLNPTSTNTCTIPIQLGDLFNEETSDIIEVTVFYTTKGSELEYTTIATRSVIYRRVFDPNISPTAIQKCCIQPFLCVATGAKDANVFNWTVSNSVIQSGQGTNQIVIAPNATGNISVTCIASRSYAIAAYTRTTEQVINRVEPEVIIVGDDFICKGEEKTFCIKDFANLCGVTGIAWKIPNNLSIIRGDSTECITVIPSQLVPDSTTGQISVEYSFEGGCKVSDQHNYTIYSSGVPPVPSGTIYATISPEASDCHGPYIVSFQANNPYTNGITTITPRIVSFEDDPIHGQRPKRIKVCYVNLCSDTMSCTTFLLYPPAPCPPSQYLVVGNQKSIIASSLQGTSMKLEEDAITNTLANISSITSRNENITIYPNPFADNLQINLPLNFTGMIKIRDMNGNSVYDRKIMDCNQVTLDVSKIFSKGIYILTITSDQIYYITTIIKH